MSPIETPAALVAIVLGGGAIIGYLAFAALCVVIERWPR